MIMSALIWAGDAATNEKAVVHVIDVDESLRDALKGLLWSVGPETRTYGSVCQFLDAHAHVGPGCIVLDVRLSGISGLDFQSRLAGLGIHLPVVLMTGHGDVLMSVRAMKAGAVDFLPKPFREQDMIDAASIAIERGPAATRRRRQFRSHPRLFRHIVVAGTAGRDGGDSRKDEQAGCRRSWRE
jgi:FixJ family two-component response regulator